MGPSDSVAQRRALSTHTSRPSVTSTVAAIPAAGEIHEQLARILASRTFQRSDRMCRFLRFAVEHALGGSAEPLKEYVVGVAVFDRTKDYDPRVDPIVRVEARRLRAKLKAYYTSQGKSDAVIVEFPKGSYLPVFRWRTAARSSTPKRSGPTSVAVLPFSNLSAETGDYFSDGLAEELILLLTRVAGLRVVAWNSSAQLRGHENDPGEIREKLKVEAVLRGSVRRAREQVRVTVQYVDTASGSVLWSEAYNRPLRDVLQVQEDIARAIVATMQKSLGQGAEVLRTPAPPVNVESYNLCLQARFHSNGRTSQGLRKSVECYQQAISKDPQSAIAYAGLSDSYALLADYGVIHPEQAIPEAKAAAQKALELNPESPEALSSLAFVRSLYDWKWEEAGSLYRRAIAISPGYSKARHWYGVDYLAMLGEFEQAEAELQKAIELDPLSLIIYEGAAYLRMIKRDYEGAIAKFRELIDMDPGFYKARSGIGRSLALQGRYDEAIVELQEAHRRAPDIPNILGALGGAFGKAGRLDEARRCLEDLHTLANHRHVGSTCFAILHLGLGEHEEFWRWMHRARDAREFALSGLHVHPLYDEVRSDARFQALEVEIGFLP